MEPIQAQRATLSDLIDRVLDKGLIINADLVVSLAGVPLIGVNLRAALAGMETMVKYGLMQDYDMERNMWLVREAPKIMINSKLQIPNPK